MSIDWLLVGLGNPGPKYETTRHNAGFLVVDHFADRHHLSLTQQKFHGRYATCATDFGKIALLEPLTFMNISGKSVLACAQFFQTPVERIIVVHDEIDLDFGVLRLKDGGGHGGHNGLRDIKKALGSGDFLRLRFGIGRPDQGDVTSHVLSSFSTAEWSELPALFDDCCDALEKVFDDGITAAQNELHSK